MSLIKASIWALVLPLTLKSTARPSAWRLPALCLSPVVDVATNPCCFPAASIALYLVVTSAAFVVSGLGFGFGTGADFGAIFVFGTGFGVGFGFGTGFGVGFGVGAGVGFGFGVGAGFGFGAGFGVAGFGATFGTGADFGVAGFALGADLVVGFGEGLAVALAARTGLDFCLVVSNTLCLCFVVAVVCIFISRSNNPNCLGKPRPPHSIRQPNLATIKKGQDFLL